MMHADQVGHLAVQYGGLFKICVNRMEMAANGQS